MGGEKGGKKGGDSKGPWQGSNPKGAGPAWTPPGVQGGGYAAAYGAEDWAAQSYGAGYSQAAPAGYNYPSYGEGVSGGYGGSYAAPGGAAVPPPYYGGQEHGPAYYSPYGETYYPPPYTHGYAVTK